MIPGEVSQQGQWEGYLRDFDRMLEKIRAPLYDTQQYNGQWHNSTQHYQLQFFQTTTRRRSENNMWYPGMLPNPNAMLVDRIKVLGLTQKYAKDGTLTFRVGNKHYLEMPLDLLIRHEKFYPLSVKIGLFPLQHFMVSFDYGNARYMGGTHPKFKVVLDGEQLRAIQ